MAHDKKPIDLDITLGKVANIWISDVKPHVMYFIDQDVVQIIDEGNCEGFTADELSAISINIQRIKHEAEIVS